MRTEMQITDPAMGGRQKLEIVDTGSNECIRISATRNLGGGDLVEDTILVAYADVQKVIAMLQAYIAACSR